PVAVEHRQLAEDLAGAQGGQGDRPAVGVLAGDAEASLLDDVAGVGVSALVENAGPGREGAGHGHVREALELALLEVGEQRHAPQQLDCALLPVRHCGRLWRLVRPQAEAVSLRGPRLKPAPISASSWPEPITGSPSSFSIASLG